MLTAARCTLAAVWSQVTGWVETGFLVGARLWRGQDTRRTAGELPQSLVVTVGETLSNPGMECCSMSSLACSQVKGRAQMIFVASAQRETQGTSRTVHGGDDAACVEIPHTDNVGPSAAVVLCCRIRTAVRWMVHTVGESRADLIGAGCRDWREAVFRLELRICVQHVQMAGSGRALGEGRS